MARERPVDPPPQDPSTETLDSKRPPSILPDRIGRYHIKRVIASGGMGTVYEATQDNPRRVVAVKVMKQGIASKSALRRFEYEGQILGRLRHPGIAQIYEAGTHTDTSRDRKGAESFSVPYFAMEYIPNAKLITAYADEKKLGTRQRMELFAKVCDAIHHGHQKGIIHRDLKPGNILVDSTGQVKIIDFGVARCTDSDLAVTTLQTDVGQLIGTLQYMSPEQCEGDPHDIDTRSDVYALGVVFYQLLCGKLPYDVTRLAMHQATRAIREQTPTKLTTINKALRGDVETIALKALEKERERRYQSAADLGHDIQRYLTGEAILARRASIVYQLRLFARRNKAVFASLAAVFVILLTGVVVSTSLYFRAEHARVEQNRERERAETERDRAEREAETARQVTEFLVGLFEVSDPSQALGETITAREILDRGVKKVGGELKDQPIVRATLQDTMGRVYASLGLYEPAEQLLREALATRRKLLGNEHPDVATSLTNVGILRGGSAETEPLLREALAIRRHVFGNEHEDVARSLYHLAGRLSWGRNYAEAEALFQEALTMQQKLLGEDRSDTIETLHDLAHMYLLQRKYDDAERMFRELLPVSRKVLGDAHPITSAALHNLAFALAGKGQYTEAELVMRESLEQGVKVLGPDHPDLIASLIFLAGLAERRGDFEEVERLAQQCLSIGQAKLAPDNPTELFAASQLGSALSHRGQFVEAEALLLQAYNGMKQPLKVSKAGDCGDSPRVEWSKCRTWERIVRMYEAWDAAESGKGYAEKAAEWRKKLERNE